MGLTERLQWINTAGKFDFRRNQIPEEATAFVQWLAARKPASLLEIGTWTGANLYYMAEAVAPGGSLESIDVTAHYPDLRRLVEEKLTTEGYTAKIYSGVDSANLATTTLLHAEYDAIFIDGDHRYGAALRDWKQTMLRLAPNGCVGFHDTCHYHKTDRGNCSAFWLDVQRFLPPVQTWELTVSKEHPLGTGVGAVAFRGRLLFMVNGGLGDAAEMTRVALVASRLGYIVHVLVISGLSGAMDKIWAKLPWITQVDRATAAKLKYTAILCPTTSEALHQRTEGLSAEIITNGGHPTGAIISDWQNVLVAIGHSREEVVGLMPKAPLAHLLPPAPDKDLVIVAPGVGSSLGRINAGQLKDKRYKHWEAVFRYLGRPLAIVGDAQAREPWMDAFKTDKEVQNLVGKDNGPVDMLPLFARAHLLLAPDNGMGHFAGLFGVPTVSVFNGATDPKKFAPPEATILLDDGKLTPGRIASYVHYAINSECSPAPTNITGGLLSVIITTHNEGDEVLLTVEDVKKNAGCPVEVIVVDDASTDGSCDHLPPYVKLLRNKERRGVAPSRNQGVAAATGEAFMFLDAHMRVLPGIPARMMLAALEKRAIIVPGVAPLYNRTRGATWVCIWVFRAGRMRSHWHSGCSADFVPTDCFVAPGWVITRREWDKLGPWPEALRHWGSTEVCKGLQAHMTGTPMLAMRDAVVWHRFRNRFPYRTSPTGIMENAYVVANVMFGDEVFQNVMLPVMRKTSWGKNFEVLLKSPVLRHDVEEFAKRRVVDPAQFFPRFFPKGFPPPEEKKPATPPALPKAAPKAVPKAVAPPVVVPVKPSFFDTPECQSGNSCVACRKDPAFRKAVSDKYGVERDYPCPIGIEASFAHLQTAAVASSRPLFFATPHCTAKVHCKACRSDADWRRALNQTFFTGGDDFACLPHKLVAANFEDGKFPPLAQEAVTLAKTVADVVSGAAAGGPVTAPAADKSRRMEICKACAIYDAPRSRCRKCGCRMDIKATLQRVSCPVGKW